MSISIIIPNYNGRPLLENNLPKVIESIVDYKTQEIEIIIVDDCSTDDSVKIVNDLLNNQLSDWKDKIKILQNEKNLGFASSVNKGVKSSRGEIVVLLNSDVIPEKNFLSPLLSHFKDPKIFGAGCMDKSAEEGKIVLRGRGVGKWQRGFLVHARGDINRFNTLWINGGSGAFRKNIWNKLGGFNTIYSPFYWEDIDLSYRALKSGYKLAFEPKSTVFHEHEKGAIKTRYSGFYIKIIAYRNQFIFAWLNATDLNLQLLHIIWLPYHFLKALIRGDFLFFVGFFNAFILLPKIIQLSFIAKKQFTKKDKEIIREFSE